MPRTTQGFYTLVALSRAVCGGSSFTVFRLLDAPMPVATRLSVALNIVPRVLCDALLQRKESGAHHYK